MASIERLLEIMARLRDPDGGCPWDVEQDFASIAPYTIEEAYEVDDAIRRRDFDALREELGDLLLQVVFHAQMAREAGRFDFDAVVEAICAKLVRRHPHVFGDATVETAEAQTHAWEEHKAAERAERHAEGGALSGVPMGLPALLRAGKLLRRAARLGFVGPEPPDALTIAANGDGARVAEELGDLLFAVVAAATRLGVEAEQALRSANARFERRFRAMEAALARQGRAPETLDAEAWRVLWSAAKASDAEPTD